MNEKPKRFYLEIKMTFAVNDAAALAKAAAKFASKNGPGKIAFKLMRKAAGWEIEKQAQVDLMMLVQEPDIDGCEWVETDCGECAEPEMQTWLNAKKSEIAS